MTLPPGTHELGPADGSLTVRTGRTGAAAKAGHDLVIDVTRWSATLTVGEAISLHLTADPRSLRVREGHGGISALGDDDKAGIAETIDGEVLKGEPIAFRSGAAELDGGVLRVDGELELRGARHRLAFALDVTLDGHIAGSAQLKQTDWRMKPYSALFGTLKVADVVEVAVDVHLPTTTRSDIDG